MLSRHRIPSSLVPLAFVALVAAGCAGTAASVRPTESSQRPLDLTGYRSLSVEVTKADGITVAGTDMERIAGRIVEAIRKKQPDRFSEVNLKAPSDPATPAILMTVQLTRYDKGNAFARAMFAGLGQMHVDATVTLRDSAKGATLGEYEVKKTFAWGGIYGAATKIEDVEVGFAEGVADVILGPKAP